MHLHQSMPFAIWIWTGEITISLCQRRCSEVFGASGALVPRRSGWHQDYSSMKWQDFCCAWNLDREISEQAYYQASWEVDSCRSLLIRCLDYAEVNVSEGYSGRANAGTTICQRDTNVSPVIDGHCVKQFNIESSRKEVAHYLLSVSSMQIHNISAKIIL